MNTKIIPIVVLSVVAVILSAAAMFTIDETEQAIVTQLGKYVKP